MWKGSLFVHCSIVPIDSTKGIKMLYVFVDIKLELPHILSTQSDTILKPESHLHFWAQSSLWQHFKYVLNDYTDGTVSGSCLL